MTYRGSRRRGPGPGADAGSAHGKDRSARTDEDARLVPRPRVFLKVRGIAGRVDVERWARAKRLASRWPNVQAGSRSSASKNKVPSDVFSTRSTSGAELAGEAVRGRLRHPEAHSRRRPWRGHRALRHGSADERHGPRDKIQPRQDDPSGIGSPGWRTSSKISAPYRHGRRRCRRRRAGAPSSSTTCVIGSLGRSGWGSFPGAREARM